MRYSNHRAARVALGLVIAASCAAACTLMKPSHDDLSGGEGDTPGAGGAIDGAPDTSLQPDASDASIEVEAEGSVEDAPDAREDSEQTDAEAEAEAAPDGPSDAEQEADAPPLACEAGGKVCQNECVAISDPEFGCGPMGCQACALASADAGCVNGMCAIGACNEGRSDCDDASTNGCESNELTDPKNCGTCGNACAAPLNMTSQCVAGECGAPVCASGWSDCDLDGGTDGGIDGCETATGSDPDNCGACGNVCPDGDNGTRECVDGKCGFNCLLSFEDCDKDLMNGCETQVAFDPLNCGVCGKQCTFAHATAQCMGGNCVLGDCNLLWGDCNNAEFDGCEKDLSSDKLNCGNCWHKCTGGQICVQGICQ